MPGVRRREVALRAAHDHALATGVESGHGETVDEGGAGSARRRGGRGGERWHVHDGVRGNTQRAHGVGAQRRLDDTGARPIHPFRGDAHVREHGGRLREPLDVGVTHGDLERAGVPELHRQAGAMGDSSQEVLVQSEGPQAQRAQAFGMVALDPRREDAGRRLRRPGARLPHVGDQYTAAERGQFEGDAGADHAGAHDDDVSGTCTHDP